MHGLFVDDDLNTQQTLTFAGVRSLHARVRRTWTDFTHSRKALGEQFVTPLLEVFAEFRIEVKRG
ncbi:hypothetical protein [Streptomyces anandii]|uniref:hypothetical protein n=1 Tax=Streptomyces anandii TaxID=285454 RepID=UPI0037BB7730